MQNKPIPNQYFDDLCMKLEACNRVDILNPKICSLNKKTYKSENIYT